MLHTSVNSSEGLDFLGIVLYNDTVVERRRQGVLLEGLFRPLDYIRKRVIFMTAYETIMVIMSILNCLMLALVTLINNNKK